MTQIRAAASILSASHLLVYFHKLSTRDLSEREVSWSEYLNQWKCTGAATFLNQTPTLQKEEVETQGVC